MIANLHRETVQEGKEMFIRKIYYTYYISIYNNTIIGILYIDIFY